VAVGKNRFKHFNSAAASFTGQCTALRQKE